MRHTLRLTIGSMLTLFAGGAWAEPNLDRYPL